MIGREKELDYVKDERESDLLNVHLAGTRNCCPVCGLAFKAIPPLRPISRKDKEIFYGGRVSFFKEVDCQCTAKYDLCIEKKFNSVAEEDMFNVIDLIILKPGVPLEELKKQAEEQAKAEAEAKAIEAVAEAIEQEGDLPTIQQRNEIKKQTILATIVDRDEKIKTLTAFTTKELQTMCKRRKLKFNKKDNKTKLAETLLAYDPSMVVANPEG